MLRIMGNQRFKITGPWCRGFSIDENISRCYSVIATVSATEIRENLQRLLSSDVQLFGYALLFRDTLNRLIQVLSKTVTNTTGNGQGRAQLNKVAGFHEHSITGLSKKKSSAVSWLLKCYHCLTKHVKKYCRAMWGWQRGGHSHLHNLHYRPNQTNLQSM